MLSTLYLKIFPRNPSNHHINYQFLQCNNPTQLPFSPLRLSSNIPHSNPHCLAQIPTLREDQLKCTLPNTAARFRHPKFSATTLRQVAPASTLIFRGYVSEASPRIQGEFRGRVARRRHQCFWTSHRFGFVSFFFCAVEFEKFLWVVGKQGKEFLSAFHDYEVI